MLFEDMAVGEPPAGVFGMFPSSLIPKLLPWLRCDRSKVLHVCSGGLPPGEGIRVDLRPSARPDFVADARALPFPDCSMAAALIDPPYSEHYARELYGTDYPLPSHLLKEAARVVRPGGRIGFVHYLVPNPPARCHHVKTFGLSMGFGYPMRAVTFYKKAQDELRWEADMRTQPLATPTEVDVSAPPPDPPPARAATERREPRASASGAGPDATPIADPVGENPATSPAGQPDVPRAAAPEVRGGAGPRHAPPPRRMTIFLADGTEYRP